MSINFLKLETKLKIKVKNKSLFIEAMTHKSANKINNNEKLEFLGDRVIGLAITKKLFDLYPNDVEGILDKKLSNLVNRKTCALISWSIGLNNFIILGDKRKKITLSDEKILSDSIESLIGAIYIDSGFNYTEKYLLEIWKKEIKKTNTPVLDPKTILQEYSLKLYKKLPVYKLIGTSGFNHKPTYKISVLITGSKNYTGTGRSKQLAEQSAAENLLKNINK